MTASASRTKPTNNATVSFDHEWTPYQAETLQSLWSGDFDLTVLRTGYGGGKTVLGGRWIHRTALRFGGEYLVLAPDFQRGGPATYRGFFEELPGEDTVPNDAAGNPENSPIVAGYNINKRRLTYINGAIARLGSADEWNRYAGTEFNGIWADEVAHYGTTNLYDLHEMLISRQRTEAGPNVSLWTSTGSGYGQFYDITERQVNENDDPLPWADKMDVIVGSVLDNAFHPELGKMRAQFEGTEREAQALHGGFSAAQGLVYSDFSREDHIVTEARANELVASDERIYGYDAGWNDPRVVVEIAKTDYGQWLVIDSFHQSESQPEDVINPETGEGWLANKPKGPMFCEHEPGHIDKFRAAGWPAIEANKDLDEGIPHVRGRLKIDTEGKPGLLVSDLCTELIQEFMSYQEEHVGKKVAEDHELDAIRYALYTHSLPEEQDSTADVW